MCIRGQESNGAGLAFKSRGKTDVLNRQVSAGVLDEFAGALSGIIVQHVSAAEYHKVIRGFRRDNVRINVPVGILEVGRGKHNFRANVGFSLIAIDKYLGIVKRAIRKIRIAALRFNHYGLIVLAGRASGCGIGENTVFRQDVFSLAILFWISPLLTGLALFYIAVFSFWLGRAFKSIRPIFRSYVPVLAVL